MADSPRERIEHALKALPEAARAAEAEAAQAFLVNEFARQFDGRHAVHADILDPQEYWAIHSDDLKLLSQAATVAAATYAAVPNPVSILSGLVVFLFQYLRKRVRLSAREAIVLRTIVRRGPTGIAFDALLAAMPFGALHESEALRQVLASLGSKRKQDGSPAKLVELAEGRYFALDL